LWGFILRPRTTWSFILRPRSLWPFVLRCRSTWSSVIRIRAVSVTPRDMVTERSFRNPSLHVSYLWYLSLWL
jgi:hypothetical protein